MTILHENTSFYEHRQFLFCSYSKIHYLCRMRSLTLSFMSLLLAFFYACSEKKAEEIKDYREAATPVLVTQIRKCARLYTAEYKLHKIITHDDDVKLKGTFLQQKFAVSLPLTHRKIAIPVDATLKAYIDFDSFTEKNVRRNGRKIEIILPDPKVELTSSRISHNEIKRYVSLMRSNFTDAELADYEQQGRAAIISSIPQLGIIEMAQESAAHTIIPMIKQLGYEEENITVTFRKDFTTDDLSLILDKNALENGR